MGMLRADAHTHALRATYKMDAESQMAGTEYLQQFFQKRNTLALIETDVSFIFPLLAVLSPSRGENVVRLLFHPPPTASYHRLPDYSTGVS